MPKRSADYMQTRRVAFCEAALACFRRKGVAATSLTDICEETGLSMGALYKHFASRDELLRAVLELRIARRNEALKGDHWPDLKAAILAFREQMNGDPFWGEFFGITDWNKDLHALRAQGGRVILAQVEELLGVYARAGEIAPQLSLRQTAHLVSVIIDGTLVAVRSDANLHVSLEDLGLYLDLAVGSRLKPSTADARGRPPRK